MERTKKPANLQVPPSGLIRFPSGAKYYGVDPRTMRRIAAKDERIEIISIGGSDFLRFQILKEIAEGK